MSQSEHLRSDDPPIATALRASFAQPIEQRLPSEFLALLIALDRLKRST